MDSRARSKIVLEENSFKFVVNEHSTIIKTWTTPWIVGTSLELAAFIVSNISRN